MDVWPFSNHLYDDFWGSWTLADVLKAQVHLLWSTGRWKPSMCPSEGVADDVAGELQSPGHTPYMSKVVPAPLLNESVGGSMGKPPGSPIKSSPSFPHLLLSQTMLHDVSHAAAHWTLSINNYFLHSKSRFYVCFVHDMCNQVRSKWKKNKKYSTASVLVA